MTIQDYEIKVKGLALQVMVAKGGISLVEDEL